jgi:CRISPR-associated protein (TIGR03984 family)
MTTPTPPITLYSYRAENITLQAAIAQCQNYLDQAIGLFYSPQKCQLFQMNKDGKLMDSYDREIKLGNNSLDTFEARLFNPNYELRWVNENQGVGTAVFLTEKLVNLAEFEQLEDQSVEVLPQQYLLWGESAKGIPKALGWQRVAEARIGKLDIPLGTSLGKKARVYLNSLEYIAEVDNFGNCAVIEERLINLEAK